MQNFFQIAPVPDRPEGMNIVILIFLGLSDLWTVFLFLLLGWLLWRIPKTQRAPWPELRQKAKWWLMVVVFELIFLSIENCLFDFKSPAAFVGTLSIILPIIPTPWVASIWDTYNKMG